MFGEMEVLGKDLQVGDTIKVWWSPNVDTIRELVPYTGPLGYLWPDGAQTARFVKLAGSMTVEPQMVFTVLNRKVVNRVEEIVLDHVRGNVTGLVSLLCEYKNEEALLLFGGEEDYTAQEIWEVSSWLADKLRARGQRLCRLGKQHYWARGVAGGSMQQDAVIQKIAKE